MRCEDCLDDLPSRHFIVFEFDELSDPEFPEYDEKHIYADCVGWYRDATEVETAA